MKEAHIALTVTLFAAIMAGYSFGRAHAETIDKPRLSGNCGPAAQGLTPVGDVVPIKVDFAGHVLVAVP